MAQVAAYGNTPTSSGTLRMPGEGEPRFRRERERHSGRRRTVSERREAGMSIVCARSFRIRGRSLHIRLAQVHLQTVIWIWPFPRGSRVHDLVIGNGGNGRSLLRETKEELASTL